MAADPVCPVWPQGHLEPMMTTGLSGQKRWLGPQWRLFPPKGPRGSTVAAVLQAAARTWCPILLQPDLVATMAIASGGEPICR
jgi:hypothetical protein